MRAQDISIKQSLWKTYVTKSEHYDAGGVLTRIDFIVSNNSCSARLLFFVAKEGRNETIDTGGAGACVMQRFVFIYIPISRSSSHAGHNTGHII